MAKTVGSTQIPNAPDAGAPAAPRVVSRAQSIASIQSVAPERQADIVQWGNGGELSGAPDGGASQSHAIEPDAPRIKPQRGEPDAPADEDEPAGIDEPEPVAELVAPKTEDEPAKETPAEKRQRALDNLAAEKRSRALEGELKTEREKRESAEKMTLGELLKARGVNKDDLLEKLLTGSDDLGLPAKLEGSEAAHAELAKTVKDLQEKLAAREQADQQRAIQEGLRVVEAELTDVGVPVIEAMGAYQDVMNEAFTMWTKAGKEGAARDHLPAAAAKVEERLRKANPRLAALADAAEKAKAAAPAARAVAAVPARAGITRRTTARPEAKPAELPDDVQERDEMIKKLYGFR